MPRDPEAEIHAINEKIASALRRACKDGFTRVEIAGWAGVTEHAIRFCMQTHKKPSCMLGARLLYLTRNAKGRLRKDLSKLLREYAAPASEAASD